MAFTLRPYQWEAVSAGVRFLKGGARYNAIEVLPTGSGKSLVIANIVRELNEPVLVFQPSKEILEQNFQKYLSYGAEATIWSASAGQKQLSDVTFATIGSVIRHQELFRRFRYVIQDECHLTNAKGGMYRDFYGAMNVKILGLTATPYRLNTDGFGGSMLKFLTRTRPRVFHDVIYYVQNKRLFNEGYLSPLRYAHDSSFDRKRLKQNSTGADFDDRSVKSYYKEIDFKDRLVELVTKVSAKRKNVMVFTRFIEESEYLMRRIQGAVMVTSETPKKEREEIVNGFRAGEIRVISNCGVFVHGFDYPELETVVLAHPTMSLARYYQEIGRVVRPHPDKEYGVVYDLCGNISMFGKVEDLKINPGQSGKWFISGNGRQLTNVYLA